MSRYAHTDTTDYITELLHQRMTHATQMVPSALERLADYHSPHTMHYSQGLLWILLLQ